jgi:hypothetical protein
MDLLVATINAVVVAVVGGIVAWLGKGRFDAVDRKVDRLEARLDDRADALGSRFDGRFDSLEARFDGRFDSLEARFDGRIDTLQSHQEGWIDTLQSRVDGRTIPSSPTSTVGSKRSSPPWTRCVRTSRRSPSLWVSVGVLRTTEHTGSRPDPIPSAFSIVGIGFGASLL